MDLFFINTSIVDLRQQPVARQLSFTKDPMQETQCLFGEQVKLIEQLGDWAYVEAVEQPHFAKDKGWTGYLGWLPFHTLSPRFMSEFERLVVIKPWAHVFCENESSMALSFGTYLTGKPLSQQEWLVDLPLNQKGRIQTSDVDYINSADFPLKLKKQGQLFLDAPYLWGGRGAYCPKHFCSVDCSSLVQLLYRTVGIQLPRNAHDQWLKTMAIKQEELQTGDLIFTSKAERIDHVMLCIEPSLWLEATMDTSSARLVSPEEKFKGQLPNKIAYHRVIL